MGGVVSPTTSRRKGCVMELIIGIAVIWIGFSLVVGVIGAIIGALFGHSPGTWK